MINLLPKPDIRFDDPRNPGEQLIVDGWVIPGMRSLAKLRSKDSGHVYFGDLPTGHGLLYPMLLDAESGGVTGDPAAGWFARLLKESWSSRTPREVGFSVEAIHPPGPHPVLLNCLDYQYGHCLLKLLNAGLFESRSDSLIVLIPRQLRWLCPAWVTEIWTVDAPISSDWNDWLDARIHQECGRFQRVQLAPGFPHPPAGSYNIKDFTGIQPFDLARWQSAQPQITFIWRDDRRWADPGALGFRRETTWRILNRLGRRPDARRWQRDVMVAVMDGVRQRFPKVKFAVCGLGKRDLPFPEGIEDLRTEQPNDEIERKWAGLQAHSHFVAGVHGSGMLLPTAHAGAAVVVMPESKWRNLGQDCLTPECETRTGWLRAMFVPDSTPASIVAHMIAEQLERMPLARLNFDPTLCDLDRFSSDPLWPAQARRDAVKGRLFQPSLAK